MPKVKWANQTEKGKSVMAPATQEAVTTPPDKILAPPPVKEKPKMVKFIFTSLIDQAKSFYLQFPYNGVWYGPWYSGKTYEAPEEVIKHLETQCSYPDYEDRPTPGGGMESVEVSRRHRFSLTRV